MISRRITRSVQQALARQAAVVLLGARQVGKTTLALDIADRMPSLYLDLEARADRHKLVEPVLFLSEYADRLVVLDEIHRVPELFQELRGIIDEGRRQGHRTGRFLILGSASMALSRQSSESLAGRIESVEMTPLTVLEAASDARAMTKLWCRGGFPDSYLAGSDADSFNFRQSFIRTFLERDVPQFGKHIAAETLERLCIMLAHQNGGLLNVSVLAASLSLSAPTVASYVDLLVDLLLVRRLRPFHANTKKRVVKAPKVYVRDSGIVHALLGVADYNQLAGHPILGASWEGFVIENLLAVAPRHTKAWFYRTAAGAEIDLVLDMPGRLWAIEIKRSTAAALSKGFHYACADVMPARRFLVHGGEGRYPVGDEVEAVGVRDMAELVGKEGG